MSDRRVPCAGGIVFDETRRLLVVRRSQPPSRGRWSIPGGRCHIGETSAAACVREVAEETGLTVRVTRFVGSVVRDGPGGVSYYIADFVCKVVGGTLYAGDDALDARWVRLAELDALPLATGVRDALAGWNCLPK